MSSCAERTSADVAQEALLARVVDVADTRTAIARDRFIVRRDVPASRAEPIANGRTTFSWEIYVRQYLAILLVLIPADAFAAGSSAGYEQGGPYARFEPVVQQYNGSGDLFRIDGHCQSSCTLFLGIRNVCIGPQASLLFHAPHDDQRRPSEYYLKLSCRTTTRSFVPSCSRTMRWRGSIHSSPFQAAI
jgi:hypothetical protein